MCEAQLPWADAWDVTACCALGADEADDAGTTIDSADTTPARDATALMNNFRDMMGLLSVRAQTSQRLTDATGWPPPQKDYPPLSGESHKSARSARRESSSVSEITGRRSPAPAQDRRRPRRTPPLPTPTGSARPSAVHPV